MLHERAAAYGIEDFGRIDGQDTVKVYDTMQAAAEYARENGPALVEAITYRYKGHGVSDRMYNSEEREDEMEEFQDRDPITVMREFLEKKDYSGLAEDLDQIHEDVEETVADAIEFARQSDDPAPEELYTHVYVDES